MPRHQPPHGLGDQRVHRFHRQPGLDDLERALRGAGRGHGFGRAAVRQVDVLVDQVVEGHRQRGRGTRPEPHAGSCVAG
ncbi:hypothetical protein AB0F52_29360 [Amycolatopsis sp. NPDC024027]|uniref:hypothetical protein n=1 Tax=Amycolatopsis sp. NPDC024027 TaxID=3154327 RepID=UPI0033D47D5B